MSYPIPNSVLQEFPELSREDITHILKKYYKVDHLDNVLDDDAKRNFVNKSELVCKIVRRHLGIPDTPNITSYPEDEIDDEINRRIKNIVSSRVNRSDYHYRRAESQTRKKILRVALGFSQCVKRKKEVDAAIKDRCILTGLSREEVERRLYCTYLNIGIKAIEVKP